MANAHDRAKLRKIEERVKEAVLHTITTEQPLPDDPPQQVPQTAPKLGKGKLSQLLDSNAFWGGVGLLVGATAASLSRAVMLFTSWFVISLALLKINFFEGRKRIAVFGGNTGLIILLAIGFVAIFRVLPKEKYSPSLDQLADASVDKIAKRFPWMTSGPKEETKIINLPPKPTLANLSLRSNYSLMADSDAADYLAKKQVPCYFWIANTVPTVARDVRARSACEVVQTKNASKAEEDAMFARISKIPLKGEKLPDLSPGFPAITTAADPFDRELTQSEYDDLSANPPRAIIFFMARVTYRDDAGPHVQEACSAVFYTIRHASVMCQGHNFVH